MSFIFDTTSAGLVLVLHTVKHLLPLPLLAWLSLPLAACDDPPEPPTPDASAAREGGVDVRVDAGSGPDAAAPPDADGAADAAVDAAAADAAADTSPDAGDDAAAGDGP